MVGIHLNGIGKSYGSVDVIKNIDLQLDEGSLTVFVGPSGCGKSTLLRMIAGLEEISKGDLVIDGKIANKSTPTERGVAMVFQNYALYPHLSVRDNIAFPLRMSGVSKAAIADQVNSAAERLRISQLLDRKPAALSGGQRQRVAIGRAIVRNPGIFLFDEPLSNLDAELRVQMRLEIANLHRSLDATMIYVTHDQVEAMTLADRMVVLRGGHVEQTGTPIEIYDNPANMFVAGFIGSPRINFLPATIVETSQTAVRISLDNLQVEPFIVQATSRLAIGQKIFAGIRPEFFNPSADIALTVIPDVVENLGGKSYLYCKTSSDDVLVVDAHDDRSVGAGRPAKTAFQSDKVLLFEKDSGARLR
ncbi:ABC transporter nucleotide binding/ATPase (sugar) [Bradyrhizobium lupini HPC(L)]|uniref:ABC transporter nucleotide binding/ATPase (Sugar) n=1 Tax=Bradyrhizobium lupini HPC(L) TaxID=1229491 RepID=A0ABP2RQW2_RHILU|nr:ABC transporter nucleotide binding/ATPase (sugar) [Bradyrhizobium lupini HPC(L)]